MYLVGNVPYQGYYRSLRLFEMECKVYSHLLLIEYIQDYMLHDSSTFLQDNTVQQGMINMLPNQRYYIYQGGKLVEP